MSEYYRGGPYVPATRTTIVTEGPTYARDSYCFRYTSNFNTTYIYWGGLIGSVAGNVSSFSSGGVTYSRGAFAESTSFGLNTYYYISRQYPSTVSINTGVPSSGTISIAQLYGATNP
jgi:hypothetical protein